jgi:hypothetical protein
MGGVDGGAPHSFDSGQSRASHCLCRSSDNTWTLAGDFEEWPMEGPLVVPIERFLVSINHGLFLGIQAEALDTETLPSTASIINKVFIDR